MDTYIGLPCANKDEHICDSNVSLSLEIFEEMNEVFEDIANKSNIANRHIFKI